MDRLKAIFLLMKQKGLRKYLEIGVFNGHILFKIKSTFKIAVDPDFAFDNARKLGKIFLNPFNLFNKYFEKKSDDFFATDAANVIGANKIDISLIDGMHEYGFALRDMENVLHYLSDDGVIIVHDCNPQTKEAAGTWEEWLAVNRVGSWNGDVWKAILHLRCTRNDINVFVLDCDHGLGVITKGKPESTLNFLPVDIEKMTYQDFDANRSRFLNLKPADYFYEYFNISRH
jgi:Methyltransferase domain